MRKESRDSDDRIASISLQRDASSPPIASNTGLQELDQTFRQRWQEIVEALHAPEKATESDALTADSLRDSGTAISVKGPAGVVEKKERAHETKVERRTAKIVSECDSIAISKAHHPEIAFAILPFSDLTPAEATSANGSRAQAGLHSAKRSRESDQPVKQQVSDRQGANVSAPNLELMVPKPSSVQMGVQPVALDQSHVRISAPEHHANMLRNQAVQSTEPTATLLSPSFVVGRTPDTTATNFTSEEETTPASPSSHASPKDLNEEAGGPGAFASAQESSAEHEKIMPPVSDQKTIPAAFKDLPGAAFPSESSVMSSKATQSTPDREAQIQEPSTLPSKTDAARRDRTAVPETSLNSHSKTSAVINTANLPVSEADFAAMGRTRGDLVPPPSSTGMMASSVLEKTVATGVKAAPIREPFAAIDAGMNDGAARWIHADSHQAEAGFQDQSLGWVSVRAQAGAGGIHAAVMPSSDAAAEVLSGHLAGLNAHLASQYEHMNAVTLSNPATGWNNHEMGREPAQRDGRGPSDGAQQQSPEYSGPASSRPVRQIANRFLDERTSNELPIFTAGMNLRDRHFSIVV